MRGWWFLIKALNAIFRMEEVEPKDDEEIEMYICAMCGCMYLDRESYVLHYKLDTCVVEKDPTPSEPFELRLSE